MEKIDNVKDPQVGKYYLVKCVLTKEVEPETTYFKPNKWLPIIGTEHEDGKYIEFPDLHYHLDWRFITSTFRPGEDFVDSQDMSWNSLMRIIIRTRKREWIAGKWSYKDTSTYIVSRPKYKRMLMKRVMPEFIYHKGFAAKLQTPYAGCKLKDGHICPHKGTSLRGVPIHNGKAVCPGHGLMFDMKTGKQVRRTKMLSNKVYA